MYKRGFTLIELLVVIAIIGILSSVVLASLNNARAKGRDAKRKSDLHQIQNALIMYYDQYGGYPAPQPQTNCGGSDPDWASSNGACGGQWLTSDVNFYQFMKNVPTDPKNNGINAGWGDDNNVYSYYPSQGGQDYELVTQLENTSDPMRCGSKAAYYHGAIPNVPWCGPWVDGMGRSQNIYADH